MGGASSQSLLCYRLSALHNVILTRAKEAAVIGFNDAGLRILGNKRETAKNILQDFYSG